MSPRHTFRKLMDSSIWGASLLLISFMPSGHAAAQTPPTISMPAGVFGVAVNPTTNLVYVLLNDNTVRIIDGASDTLTATVIPVCSPNSFGGGLDVNPQTNKIYVAHQSCGGNMQVISGVTNTVTATVSLGGCPSGPRVNPLTNRVYIVAQCIPEGVQDGLYVVDGSADTVIDANPGPGRPFDLNGVASSVVVNPTTNTIYTTVTPGFDIGGLTTRVINGVTNTLVTSIPGVHVGVVNPTTNRFYGFPDGVTEIRIFDDVTHTQIGTIPGVTGSMDVNPDTNRIYVALQSLNQLAVIEGNTNTVSRTVALGFSPTLVATNHSTGKVYVSISGGTAISVVQDTAIGTPFAWGFNASGQLGTGNFAPGIAPAPVSGLTGVSAIAAGGGHSLALKPATPTASSTVFSWGNNSVGQLGVGASPPVSNVPLPVGGFPAGTIPLAIAAGASHSLAMAALTNSASSTVFAWGSNSNGQLGAATSTTSSNIPIQVTGGPLVVTNITAIAAGGLHSMAMGGGPPGSPTSVVVTWGENSNGQLGHASSFPALVEQIGGPGFFLSNVAAIAGGFIHSLAIQGDIGTASTSVFAWGSNTNGQVGTSACDPCSPTLVNGLANVVAIAGGNVHSLALKSDGTVRAWGRGDLGELGNGGNSQSNTPVQVVGPGGVGFLNNIIAIAASNETSFALRNDGALFGWGDNTNGQISNLSCVPNCNLPVQVQGQGGVGSLTNVVAIGQGILSSHALAISTTAPLANVTVPNVVGQPNSAVANLILTGAGLTLGTVTITNNIAPAGQVLTQNPTAGSSVAPGTAANLTVSSGPVSVPNVVGAPQAAAAISLTNAGLTLGTVTITNNIAPASQVLTQNPAAGSSVVPGTAVNLTVSSGPVSVPNVVGQSQATASTNLTNAGLAVGTVTVANNIAPASQVLLQNPIAGSNVAPGTAVNLTVSSGPVSVPNVVGQPSSAAANTILTGAGLTLGTVTSTANIAPAGQVLLQNPTAGSGVIPGTAVNLTISLGLSPVSTSIDARLLKAAGFASFEIVGQTGSLDTAVVQNLTLAPSTSAYTLRAPFGGGAGQKTLTFKVNAQCDLTVP